MRLLRSTAVVGGFTLVSRFFGVARDILLAARLGAGPVADAFLVALQFPNLFRRIFAEGAFNSAFVPLYARRLEGEGAEAASQFARDVISMLATFVLVLVVAAQIAMPWLMYALGPGFIADPDLFAFAVLMTQITMPYLLCMSVAAMLSGVLNSHERFAAAAAAPVLLNVVLIALLMLDRGERHDLALYLSAGVTFSGVLQVIWLWMAAQKAGVRLGFHRPRLTPGVRRLIVLGLPGAAAAGVTHINQLISGSIATLQEGARSWIYYAERLYQLPLGVIGIAMGVALLPMLAKRLRAGDETGALAGQNRAIEISMALTLPAAAALMAIPALIVTGLFERGEFNPEDSANTALALAIYAAGLPAFVLIKVFSPGFFAREDTMTPMKFAALSVVLNIVIGVTLFFGPMKFAGLALATSLAGWINALMLAGTLVRRNQFEIDARLKSRLPRILAACAAMAGALWAAAGPGAAYGLAIAESLVPEALAPLTYMLVLVALGAAVYGLAAIAFGALRPSELISAMRRPAPSGGDSA